MTLAEIAVHLEDAHDLRVSRSAVWRFFHRRGSPNKDPHGRRIAFGDSGFGFEVPVR